MMDEADAPLPLLFNSNTTVLANNHQSPNLTNVVYQPSKRSIGNLWVPYVLIGLVCMVFLAVHFWCYHRRNRERYLRKREEMRVKAGLLERNRISTRSSARIKSEGGLSALSSFSVVSDFAPCSACDQVFKDQGAASEDRDDRGTCHGCGAARQKDLEHSPKKDIKMHESVSSAKRDMNAADYGIGRLFQDTNHHVTDKSSRNTFLPLTYALCVNPNSLQVNPSDNNNISPKSDHDIQDMTDHVYDRHQQYIVHKHGKQFEFPLCHKTSCTDVNNLPLDPYLAPPVYNPNHYRGQKSGAFDDTAINPNSDFTNVFSVEDDFRLPKISLECKHRMDLPLRNCTYPDHNSQACEDSNTTDLTNTVVAPTMSPEVFVLNEQSLAKLNDSSCCQTIENDDFVRAKHTEHRSSSDTQPAEIEVTSTDNLGTLANDSDENKDLAPTFHKDNVQHRVHGDNARLPNVILDDQTTQPARIFRDNGVVYNLLNSPPTIQTQHAIQPSRTIKKDNTDQHTVRMDNPDNPNSNHDNPNSHHGNPNNDHDTTDGQPLSPRLVPPPLRNLNPNLVFQGTRQMLRTSADDRYLKPF